MHVPWRVSRGAGGLGVVVALLAVLLVGVTPAAAGVKMSAGPDYSSTASLVNVGDTRMITFSIQNTSDGTTSAVNVTLTGIVFTPSCASSSNNPCLAADADPDVFQVDDLTTVPAGTIVGEAGTACAGVTFTLGTPDLTTGAVPLIPSSTIQLGPSKVGGLGATCVIDLSITVLKTPTKDADGTTAGLQTNGLGFASGTAPSGTGTITGTGTGSDVSTVTGPSLEINKTPDGGTISAGQDAEFTIVVSNNGDGTANNVTVTDQLPAGSPPGFTWTVSQQPSGGNCTITGVTLNCTLGDMPPGDSRTIKVSTPTTLATCGPIVNDINGGAIACADNQPACVNNPGDITCQPPDLHINKTPDSPADVNPNGTITAGQDAVFNIVVSNGNAPGTGTASNVTLTDQLPPPANPADAWTVVSVSQGTCDPISAGSLLTCHLGNLAPGASVTVVVKRATTAEDCGVQRPGQQLFDIINDTNNGANAQGDNTQHVSDPGQIVCQVPKLQIVKSPKGGTYTLGDLVSFSMVVTNLGPGTATNVTLDDTLPPNLNWTTTSTTKGTCAITGALGSQKLHCDLGDLTVNQQVTVTFSSQTQKDQPQECVASPGIQNNLVVTNGVLTGSVACGANVASCVNDTGSQSCVPPDLHIVKTPDNPGDLNPNGTITAGQDAVFNIVVSNGAAAGPAFNVTLTDQLPAPANAADAWTVVSVSQGTCDPVSAASVLTCHLGDLASGASVTVVVKRATTAADCGVQRPGTQLFDIINDTNNGANAKGDNTANVFDPGKIVCQVPKLQIVKSPKGGTYNLGDLVTFSMVVTNLGPGTATNVTLDDTLPADLSWTTSSTTKGTCNITGAQPSQKLHCDLGDLTGTPQQQVTVTFSSQTDAGTPAQCVASPGIQNNLVVTNGVLTGSVACGANAACVNDTGSQSCSSPCDISIEKTCVSAPAAYVCTKPITALTMQWTGGVSVRIAGTAGVTPFDIDNIDPSDVITVSGYDGSQGNNVLWNICSAGSVGTCDSSNPAFLGQSSFHLSCSDADMNTADDCGKLEGDNKLEQGSGVACVPGALSNTSTGCVNLWVLAGMTGPIGSGPSASLVCPGFGSSTGQTTCSVTLSPYVCTKPITSLTMKWTGPIAISVRAQVTSGGSTGNTPIVNIQPGDTITVSGYDGSLGNNVLWNIYDATNTTLIAQSSFHLSCSDADMNTSDDCGKLEGDNKLEQGGSSVTCFPVDPGLSSVTASNGCVNGWVFEGMTGPLGSPASASLDCANPNGSAPMTFNYVVTNNTGTAVSGVKVTDTITDASGTTTVDICTEDLAAGPGTTFTCSSQDQIGSLTTDIAHAAATGCTTVDSNEVTVNVSGGGGGACPTAATTLTAKDLDVKWKITAPKTTNVVISKIEITFPQATNGALKEIHLAAPRIFKGSASSPATITTFAGSTKDRTIEKGHTEELRFHFSTKPVALTGYTITVTFTNGGKGTTTKEATGRAPPGTARLPPQEGPGRLRAPRFFFAAVPS